MRLIPVIDLKEGLVVHAVKGERSNYQPVKSVLCQSPDPIAVARAFRYQLGLTDLYVADLDAIQNRGDHRHIVTRLANQENMTLYLDAGISQPQAALAALENGARKVIIGAETLPSWQALRAVSKAVPVDRLIFSLDMVQGKVLSSNPELASLAPAQLLERVVSEGWNEVILLDLARVGAENGVDRDLIKTLRRNAPQVSLLIGGGVRNMDDLAQLEDLGVDGVLLATALHRGVIDARHRPQSGSSPERF